MIDINIAYFSDTHNKHENVDIDPCDILIFGGDMSNVGGQDDVESFLKWFNNQPALHRVMIAGNHDISFDRSKGERPSWLKDALGDYLSKDNNHYLENSSCNIWNINIWGSPYSKCYGSSKWAFNVCEGPEADLIYKQIPSDTDIVITHGPAYGRLDYVPSSKEFAGSDILLWHLKRVKPTYTLCGHIHEGYGEEISDYTTFYNGCVLNEDYDVANKPFKIKLEVL